MSRPRWLLLLLVPICLLLFPLLFEEQVGRFATATVQKAQSEPWLVAILIVLALALDVFLPVPNGVTNTLAGAAFGFALGVPVIWCGLMAASLLGYLVGALAGLPLARRLVGQEEIVKAHRFAERLGPLMLIFTRPVPMVAEMAAMAAGMAQMPLRLFIVATGLSNLAIAVIFAGMGSAAIAEGSKWLMLFGAVGLPLGAWLAFQAWSRRRG